MKKLANLLDGLEHEIIQGDPAVGVSGVENDSRRVGPGNVFVCISGFKKDGHLFAREAVLAGAVAVVAEKEVSVPAACTVVRVSDSRRALARLASRFFEQPSRELKVIGVTGTNGKTSTAHLISAVLQETGYRVGILGTLYASWDGEQEKIANTTPDSLDLERFMRRVKDDGGEYVVMEVSSHAIDMERVEEIEFASAVFTNLTQDHLDYHGTMEEYREVKGRLFSSLGTGAGSFGVINEDDPAADYFKQITRVPVITFGLSLSAQVRAVDVAMSFSGSSFTVLYPGGQMRIKLKLAGMFSIYNALAAIAFSIMEGLPEEAIARALAAVTVPGRFECIEEGQDFSVVVDYAHTPDGLESLLCSASQLAPKRIITVFGCGGDRDRAKRPLMGHIAASLSDFVIITSDNPRSEEPLDIIGEIMAGVRRVEDAHYAVVPDRREAVHHAVQLAGAGDLVVIAGKGHEDYQIIKGVVYPFDDRVIARECIRSRMNESKR